MRFRVAFEERAELHRCRAHQAPNQHNRIGGTARSLDHQAVKCTATALAVGSHVEIAVQPSSLCTENALFDLARWRRA
jgi:hypothetical protein